MIDTLQQLRDEADSLIKKETAKNILYLQGIIKNSPHDKHYLRECFQQAADVALTDEKKYLKKLWKNEDLPLPGKRDALILFLANKMTSSLLAQHYMPKFFKIITTSAMLELFLTDPKKYIANKKHLSSYELYILQLAINDPDFNALPSVNRTSPKPFMYLLAEQQALSELKLSDYRSNDAITFEECINPDEKENVLSKIKQTSAQIPMTGYGALPSGGYNDRYIRETAKQVKKTKTGVCHTFAQLALDHYLTLINQGKMADLSIKMVSHVDKTNSHTFLLIGHNSDDLHDLSNCLIVDAWAVAMGFKATDGVFIKENYPYLHMATKLECVYTHQPVMSQEQIGSPKTVFDEEKKAPARVPNAPKQPKQIISSYKHDRLVYKLRVLTQNYLDHLEMAADNKQASKIENVSKLLEILDNTNQGSIERVDKFYKKLGEFETGLKTHRDPKWQRFLVNAMIIGGIIATGILPGLAALALYTKTGEKEGKSFLFWRSHGNNMIKKIERLNDTLSDESPTVNKGPSDN